MANIRSLVTINNTPLPEPSKYDSNTATLVDSSRNSEGVIIGAVIRDQVSKVSMSWDYLTVKDWANINKIFSNSFINSVVFFDQSLGDWNAKNMYVSDRSAGMWRRDPITGDILGWTGCKLSLVEV